MTNLFHTFISLLAFITILINRRHKNKTKMKGISVRNIPGNFNQCIMNTFLSKQEYKTINRNTLFALQFHIPKE